MASQSFTILPFINPPAGVYDAINAVSSLNNNFSVSQSFNGIVNSGSESCASLIVSGQTTLNGGLIVAGNVDLPAGAINQSEVQSGYVDLLNAQTKAGILTLSSPPVMSGASISANTIPALSIVNDSLGDAQISAGGVGQSSVASGYVDLANAQTKLGVLTLSSPPVMSGASISANTIPALSIVNDSLGDAQISAGGVGQDSVASGYVDLVNAQSAIAGAKSFSNALTANLGLTVNGGVGTFNSGISTTTLSSSGSASLNSLSVAGSATVLNNLNVTNNINAGGGITAPTFTGALTGNASTATLASTVSITTDNTSGSYFIPFIKTSGSSTLFCDSATVPLMTYNPSTGLISSSALTISGNSTLSGVILPVAQTILTITAGAIALNLNNLSKNEFLLPSAGFTANITSITFSNAIVNSKFNIYIQGGTANRNISKNLGAGQVNNLAGNTQISASSTWRCSGVVLSPTLVALDFKNFT